MIFFSKGVNCSLEMPGLRYGSGPVSGLARVVGPATDPYTLSFSLSTLVARLVFQLILSSTDDIPDHS